MSVLLVIPARFASTRFPGKPLSPLTGATGIEKTLLERSWLAAKTVSGIDRVVVATESEEIKSAAETFGAEVVMTSDTCRNGTERCAEAHAVLGGGYDIIVNLQGDAPLTPAWFVEELVPALKASPDAAMTTPALRCSAQTLNNLKNDRLNNRVGGTTVVFDRNHHGLFFSKEVLPYTAGEFADGAKTPVFHHVGVYAYRADSLAQYAALPECELEQLEGLEQLRFLYNDLPVLCVEVDAQGRTFWELNNPEDRPIIEAALLELGVE
jgi:3-deoxy-manno-octulosonate cytidylyltransferase (CMP-KDO synthetase)